MIATIINNLRNNIGIFLGRTIVIAYVLEAVEYHYPFKNVLFVILGMVLYSCLSMIYGAYYFHKKSEEGLPKVKEKIELMLYNKAKDLDLAYYDNTEYYNEFILAVSQVEKQISHTIELLQMILTCICVIFTNGAYFFVKDKASIIFMFVAFCTSMFANKMYNKINFEFMLNKNQKERERDYINRVFYLNDYAKEIRLNKNVTVQMLDKFQDINDEIYEINKKYGKKKFFLGFMKDFLCNNLVSDILYLVYLVYKAVIINLFSCSQVVVLYNSSGRLKRAMRTCSQIIPYAGETSLYINKIRDFLEIEPSIKGKSNIVLEKKPTKIELKNITFSYVGAKNNVINGINMTIQPGEKIALVGYNGAGKSTLIKLLLRLYDATTGVILIDGKDIREYGVREYRKNIAVVFQDYALFAATVRENIILDQNKEDVDTSDAIYEAIQQSGLHDKFIKLQNGLDTEITKEFYKDGINLSGGESQKLAIARAFYKNAGLIILDEPSSALDPIAEYQLNKAILSASHNKTVIFISHRLSTTRFADRIYMLEYGTIIESGTHEELLTLKGKYAKMWSVQAGRYCESLG
ncbi:MAG: ABC transporter ATP-binding protein [Hungatella sp.]|nr:ABC transporter ATP-binding protein [Hungatella sp.]